MLFSEGIRTDSSPKGHGGAYFAHLDRSARPEYYRIRALLETWLTHLPAEEQQEMTRRIQSRRDNSFHSVILELYVHELLLATKHQITIHPTLPTTSKRPDFLAERPASQPTLIEGTVITEKSTEEMGADKRLNTLFDSIDRLNSPDFFITLDIEGSPNTPVPGQLWQKRIQAWIDSLAYDVIATIGQDGRFWDLPVLELKHDGLVVTSRPMAKKQLFRGTPGARLIGAHGGQGSMVDSHLHVYEAVKSKALRYGKLDQPYIIVINCLGPNCDFDEIQMGLYGSDGLWSPNSQLFTRVSAVLAIQHFLPWTISKSDIRLYHSPYAAHPYTGQLTALPQARVVSGTVTHLPGTHPNLLFGLAPCWPREKAYAVHDTSDDS